MKNKKFIIIGIVVLDITLLVILLVRRERNVNVYEFPPTLVVNNLTTHKNANTYSKIILNKVYDYDTITLNIYYAPKDYSVEEYEVLGFIQKNRFEPHYYNIFLKKGTLSLSIKNILSHELIHLHQMEIGDLISIPDTSLIIHKGDTISLLDVPYNKRPFEIEALSQDNKVLKELNHLLYSK